MAYSKRQIRQAWIRRRRRRGDFVPPDPSAPVNTMLPMVMGGLYVGDTLTSTTGSWTGYPVPSYEYEWIRAPSTVVQARSTNNTYVTQAGDDGANIFCRVYAINSEAPAGVPADSAPVGPIVTPVAPSETSAPAISGTGEVGQTLSVSTPAVWNLGEPPATITSTWLRNGTPISGSEGSSTYLVVALDDGTTITYQETATNIAGAVVGTASNGIDIGVVGYIPSLNFSNGRNSMYLGNAH